MNATESYEKQESVNEVGERTRPRQVFVPRVDIFESPTEVVIVADMPGVDQSGVDITIEKNVLTLKGTVDTTPPAGYSPIYAEYGVGDYERTFTISNAVDRDGVQATIKNGVLRLTLPKAKQVLAKKVTVAAG